MLLVSAVPPGLRLKDLATETTTMSAQKGSNAFFSSPLAACISSLASVMSASMCFFLLVLRLLREMGELGQRDWEFQRALLSWWPRVFFLDASAQLRIS